MANCCVIIECPENCTKEMATHLAYQQLVGSVSSGRVFDIPVFFSSIEDATIKVIDTTVPIEEPLASKEAGE